MLRGVLSLRAYWLLADAQARAQARPFNLPVCYPCGYGRGYGRGYARVGLAPGGRFARVGRIAPTSDAYDLTFRVSLFQGDHDVDQTIRAISHMMDALVAINVDYLRAHPEAPSVYQSGVRYQAEEEDEELWQDVPAALRQGTPDCEDLAAWRVAELIVREGVAAQPRVTAARQPDGKWLFHITVLRPDGAIEDPSAILGMR